MPTDRQFRVSGKWALASDGVQWILQRRRGKVWEALKFIRSTKAHLILLFRYGMPYRVRSEGKTYRVLSGSPDQERIKADRRYDRWGKLGLLLIVLGTMAQIGALFF